MKNIQTIKDVIVNTIPPESIKEILIFGSNARNETTQDSDIDICIITNAPMSYEETKKYRGQMSRIFAFKYRVSTDILIKSNDDYIRYQGVIGAIENEIMREGIVI